MDIINSASRQRGRVIDFNELLYGYTRLDPLHGADHVLDLLLRYRRYRGRKLTAAVRRHAYLQQAFAGTFFHTAIVHLATALLAGTLRLYFAFVFIF